jgi:TATA-box binding protein (TBP) (component of TFIID and TFIIIB)
MQPRYTRADVSIDEYARYDPKVFPAVVWQHRKIGGICLLFYNGKINCNGKFLSLQDGGRRLRRYARKLQKMDYPVRLTNVRVVTASTAHQFIERIDPTRLPKDVNY